MSDRKKPGKNSSRMGRKKPVSTADEAYESTAIPSPFLRAGFDIGVDISVPPRQNSKDTTVLATACDASGQADATTTTTTTNTNTFASHTPGSSAAAASTKKSSSAQATKRGRAIISNKKALALDALGLKDDNTPATNKKSKAPKAPKASKAAPATPKKPKEGKTAAPPKVTPSKRTHDASFPDLSYWSSSKSKDEDNVFESDSDSAAYKKNDRSDYLEHSSDNESDYLKREREFALGNEDDDDDEYLKHYHGEDTPIKKPRT